MPVRNIVFVLILLAGFAPALRSQILPESASSSQFFSATGGSFYNFASGSGCDLMVSVWGYVRNPGRYRVPCETNLLDLLSFCGGPNDRGAEVFLDRVKVVRKGGVDRENEIAEVYEVDVRKYLELRDTPLMTSDLQLFPGDLIIVDGEQVYRDMILRIAQTIVAIASVITSTVAVINIATK